MTNLEKRILTSVIILPLSIFFIVKGGYFLTFFLTFIFFAGVHELSSVFKKKKSTIFLSLILILSLFSIYYLSEVEPKLLYFAIAVTISSDIGGYVFGKIFQWKKLTKISPKKTFSGVFGSYFFSLLCLFIWNEFALGLYTTFPNMISALLWTVIFSTVAQGGDLIISYLKRLEKIKDSGKILPGHGGIFDRIDGLMFVVILASIYYYLII
tara:strand:- start:2171 stop:2803 length:633 start_codon:yes stop_codon:yes gene_type:complete